MPRKFRPFKLKLPNHEDLSAIPLVLQSTYQWNKDAGTVTEPKNNGDAAGVPNELQLIPEALDLLKTIKKNIAVLSICGPYRSGKSFFISRVVGEARTFKLGHSMEVCTRGIWLSTTALECDEFVLLLLDTEGIGAMEGEGPESFTTKLLVTTILLSSFLIYNSMEVPKQADLQQMSSFAHLSTAITISDKSTKVADPSEFQKHFPRFMWLLRDVINPPSDENGEDIPLMDYLHEEVFKPTGQKDSDSIVSAICTLFPQPLLCRSLPPPNDDLTNLENEKNIDPEFIEEAQELIDGEEGIKASIRPKLGFYEGALITGSDLAELASSYIKAINEKGSVPSLEGSWKAVVKLKLVEEAKSLVVAYQKEMKTQLEGKLPIEESIDEADCQKPTLMGIHLKVFAEKKAALCEKIRQLLPKPSEGEPCAEESEIGKSVIEEFEHSILVIDPKDGKVKSGVLFQFVTENFKESEKQCEKLWEQLQKRHEILKKSNQALNQYKAEICREVCECIQSLREEYNAEAVGPAREKVFERKNEDLENTHTLMCTIPGPPINIAVVGKAKDKIKLQWDRPEINPDAAKKYIVKYRTGTKKWEEASTSEQWHIVNKLKPNTKYEFIVASFNDEAQRAREEIEKMSKGLLTGTRLGRLARAALSAMGFISGTAVAPILCPAGTVALATESSSKLKAFASILSIPFPSTLGAPIVGGKVVYHVIKETGDWGDLEERYVPRETAQQEEQNSSENTT